MSIRIMVADDHLLFMEALAETLNQVQDFDVVGIAGDCKEIIPTALRSSPTVALLGTAGPDWLRQAAELGRRLPTCGVAVIGANPTRGQVDRAVAAGVLSVVPKHAKLPYLIGAIRGVAAGCVTIDPRMFCPQRPADRTLSDREIEILQLTATGASIKEIAKELYLAAGTVRNLASTAIKKLDGRNRFDAARIAGERGWL
jgi:two-component system response regulator DesR